MKAVQIHQYGGPEVIEVSDEVHMPSITDSQVLVEVHAASLNPVDWKFRQGNMKGAVKRAFPFTLGGDFAGIVVNVGSEVTDLKPGDQVFGSSFIMNGGSGALAEFTACNRKNMHLKPDVYFYEAAALPLTGSSAVQALTEQIQLKEGQKILIHGGAGGIGSLAIQLAKAMGAKVATTVSKKEKDLVKGLGADKVINYKKQEFDEEIQDYDAVLDTVGGETYRRSFRVLKEGGVINSMLESPDEKLAEEHKVNALYQHTVVNPQRLSRLSEYIGAKGIKPVIDREFELDTAREAFAYLETHHCRGKVIIKT
ncbi:MAG: NADP-dependent oxidoreductase [Chitinispirillaceae bacterium]